MSELGSDNKHHTNNTHNILYLLVSSTRSDGAPPEYSTTASSNNWSASSVLPGPNLNNPQSGAGSWAKTKRTKRVTCRSVLAFIMLRPVDLIAVVVIIVVVVEKVLDRLRDLVSVRNKYLSEAVSI
jgi:hypothetical protein